MRSTALTFLVLSSLALAAPLRTGRTDHDVAQIDTPKNLHQDCDMRNPQCKAENGVVYHSADEFEKHLGKQEGVASNTASKDLAIEGFSDLSHTASQNGQTLKHDLQARHRSHQDKDGEPHQFRPDPKHSGKEDYALLDEGHKSHNGSKKPLLNVEADAKLGHGGEGKGGHRTSTRGHSETNKDLKEVAGEVYPEKGIKETGNEVKKTGEVVSTTGNGVHDIGYEANNQFNVIGSGEKGHSGEFIHALVN